MAAVFREGRYLKKITLSTTMGLGSVDIEAWPEKMAPWGVRLCPGCWGASSMRGKNFEVSGIPEAVKDRRSHRC